MFGNGYRYRIIDEVEVRQSFIYACSNEIHTVKLADILIEVLCLP